MKNILFIHQSAELYGSDKTLLMLVVGFKEKGHNPIVVVPDNGPLVELLEKKNIPVIITPVIKISRKMFGIFNLISLPAQVISSINKIDSATKGIKIDCIYSNTLAVLIGIVYAEKRNLKHIWHVHEIIENPRLIRRVFTKLLSLKNNTEIIYNSFSTKLFWEKSNKLSSKKSTVVWNGVSKNTYPSSSQQITELRVNLLGCQPDDLIIGLIGRINRWKGHQLLLDALKDDLLKNKSVKLVFIGSPPPQQDVYLEILQDKIVKFGLMTSVKIIPFQDNIWPVWEAIDIAVVPSTEPEPFGLVALEAMLCQKAVIASNHGGLTEIISNNETGLLFEPNNQEALTIALRELISNKAKRLLMGNNGYNRATNFFTLERYVNEIEKICLNV